MRIAPCVFTIFILLCGTSSYASPIHHVMTNIPTSSPPPFGPSDFHVILLTSLRNTWTSFFPSAGSLLVYPVRQNKNSISVSRPRAFPYRHFGTRRRIHP